MAVCHVGFLKFKFLTAGVVKAPILHHPADFTDISQATAERERAIFFDFPIGGRCHLDFLKNWKF